MSSTEIKKDLLSQLLYEAQAYKKFEDIEKLVETQSDLSMIPLQPLYVAIQNTSKEQIAMILPKLSSEQRQALRDVDLWKKDEVDPQSVYNWIEIYSKCEDDAVVLEFAKSEDFLLSLKNQFTIQTFDAEDPMYPDDDNYFLTEDNLLLIAYPEDFVHVQELKEIIRRLYGDMGVEYAYAFLFKMVVDSYQLMEEDLYQEKIERLRDFGFVDYFEALETTAPFLTLKQVNSFIQTKKGVTAKLDSQAMNQSLHSTSLTPYQNGMEDIKTALGNLSDNQRSQFLHFNFVRLVNAQITLDDALKNGSLAVAKVGSKTKISLELGYDYVLHTLDKGDEIFTKFDFIDLYKIGHSLIEINRKEVKKALSATSFDLDEFNYFLGMYWNAFIDNTFEEVTKYKFDGSSKALEINSFENYQLWIQASESFMKSLPFIQKFFLTVDKLKSEGHLNDEFYLNYEVDNIDFEAIILSSFINDVNGHYNEQTASKMGLTIGELKTFYSKFFVKHGSEYLLKGDHDETLKDAIQKFLEKFGLIVIPRSDKYLRQILIEQLNGYSIDEMDEEEFRHIGGPILLNFTKN